MSEQKCRKVYVPVNLDVDAEGNIRPRLIRWMDGRVYEIDRLKHKCRAASTKVGGCGIRYTVMMSDSKLSFPPAANFPQIKFGSASMLSLSTCCILRHVFICHLDQIHIFPYSLIV